MSLIDSMIPWFGFGQFVKGVLRKYRVEVTEVWQDVLFVVHGLGVQLEALRKLLENCSSCADMLRLGEESSCPDSVAFFKWFILEVSFQVRRQLGCRLSFIFLVSIFCEGWERASPAGIYPFGVLPLGVLFCPAVGSTADAAAQETPGHFDGSGMEIDLWIVLVQPGEPEYHALLAEAGDCEQNIFGMLFVGHDHVHDFVDAPGLIKGSMYIVNQDWLAQLVSRKFCSGDKVLVNEVSGSTGINHGVCG